MPIVILFTFNYFFIPRLLDKGQFTYLHFLLLNNYMFVKTRISTGALKLTLYQCFKDRDN